MDNEDLLPTTMARAELWTTGLGGPTYAIDEETAIKVIDGAVVEFDFGTLRISF